MQRYAKFGLNAIGNDALALFDESLGGDKEQAMFQLLLEYDEKTAVHSIEVARMLSAFAVSGIVDFDHSQQIALPRMGIAHDAGKRFTVDKSILNKPGRLSDTDWLQVKQHPRAGFELMMQHGFTDIAVPILLHHELQPHAYEKQVSRDRLLGKYAITPNMLNIDDKKIWIDTLLLAIADHYSTRYPLSIYQRSYVANGRHYNVEDMDQMIRADFIEAGRVRELGLEEFMVRALSVAQEVAMASRPLPVALPSKNLSN